VWGIIYDYVTNFKFPKSEDSEPKSNLCYLAKNAGSSISIFITYIVFLTKMQKRQTLLKAFALMKTISQQFFIDMILVFYCRNQKLDIKKGRAK
jgi:hypothetical protein